MPGCKTGFGVKVWGQGSQFSHTGHTLVGPSLVSLALTGMLTTLPLWSLLPASLLLPLSLSLSRTLGRRCPLAPHGCSHMHRIKILCPVSVRCCCYTYPFCLVSQQLHSVVRGGSCTSIICSCSVCNAVLSSAFLPLCPLLTLPIGTHSPSFLPNRSWSLATLPRLLL